jgi:hypothetical protein
VLKFGKPWWELPKELAARAIIDIQEDYDRHNSWRRARARRLVGGYQNRNLNTPFMRDAAYSWPGEVEWVERTDEHEFKLIRNKFFEYVETYVSKVAAEENPQPALMVTDGDYELKRRVTLATRLLEAEYDQRQGLFPDLYSLAHHGLRLAYGATGSVAAKIYPWPKEDRVVVELHDTLDMFLDDSELSYNNPRTFGELTWWPPERLAASVKPQFREKIFAAVEARAALGLSYNETVGRIEQVPVWEAWAMRVGDEDGKHIMCLRDGTVLVWEDWDETEPPYAFLHAAPSMVGFWGNPPIEYAYDEILKTNEILTSCDFAHTHTDRQVHYVYEQAIEDIADLEQVHHVKVVKTKQRDYVPTVENPPPFNRLDLELLAEHERGIARTLGIDEMHSGAKAEPGLPSAVAQREAASRFDDRAAWGHRAYQHWVAVDIARHLLKAQRKLYESNRAFKRKWRGELFSKEISAKDIVDLDLEALEVRIKPIGEKKNTPEERVQYAQELMESGSIPFEAYIMVLQHYDTPGETRAVKTQRRWLAWQIDGWRMAGDDEPVRYLSPRPWMRKSDAMVQVIDALMEAEMDEIPQERLQYFLDFISELVQMMSNEVNPPAAPAPPLGALPPTQGAAGMNAGAQGLMAPGLGPMLPPGAPPAPAVQGELLP